MTFFYDLNKRMAELANKQTLAEGKGAKPDFLDIDKDGNKTEPMKKAVKDKEIDEASYSAKSARAGKDIGKPGKAFSKIAADAAERYGSKEKGEKVAGAVLAKLRAKEDVNEADVEEGNEFSGALAKAKAAGASEFEVDGKKYKVTNEASKDKKADPEPPKNAFDPEIARSMFAHKDDSKFEKKKTATGTIYKRKPEPEDEKDDEVSDVPKKKGRKEVGAGKGKKLGAKSHGTSKLARKGSIAEDDSIALVDKGEYDREGDMAKEQLHTIELAAKELASILSDDENLPEWVQSKITKAMDYVDTARDYMISTQADQADELVAEKAVSQAQRKAAGIARAAQKGDIPKSELRGASKEMAKMPAGELKKFAKTKEKGLPEKVKEADAEEPKAKGGIQFGKGIYESINSQVEKMITEGMNVSVNMSTDSHGQPTKNITISAEGDDAETLAQLLNLAGLQNKEAGCGCGQTPCGYEQVEEAYGDTTPTENKPDYPTDEETTGEDDELLRRWAGGLNKPKSTGQTTIPVIASQATRQVSEETKADKLGLNLYAELKSFKAK
jgi:hypothetical protein